MKVKIVGHGIAALMLAEKLQEENVEVVVLGKGPPQSPPQVMVHLYAGRSFRRSNIELDAFQESIDYWRKSPFSTETSVTRDTHKRLEKSLDQTANYPWASPVLENQKFSYGPGFVIDAEGLIKNLRGKIEYRNVHIENESCGELDDCDHVVWATGFKNGLSYCTLNTGASIAIDDTESLAKISIGKGFHHASNSQKSSIGGSFLNENLDDLKSLLLERAESLISIEEKDSFETAQLFIGKKSVSKDRLPVVGRNNHNTFLFSAFGARAFFWLPLSSKLAYHLLIGDVENPRFAELSPRRFERGVL